MSSITIPTATITPPPSTGKRTEAVTEPVTVIATAATATLTACPTAIAGRARRTWRRPPSCNPLPTASNHPMPGCSPWKAPRATRVQS